MRRARPTSCPSSPSRSSTGSPDKPGTYTASVQYLDGELNYSKPVLAQLTVVPPWFRNAFIMVPSGGALLGLLGWAFVARSLVIRRKREAEELREQLFEQEHKARLELEAEEQPKLAEARIAADEANKAKSEFPREHEPRVAHADERHHRLQRNAPGGSRRSRTRKASSPTSRKSTAPANICSASSTTFSISRRSKPAR